MTFIVYLVLLTSMTPAPTFVILDDFTKMSSCQTAIKEFAKKANLTPEQTNKLACMPLITSPLTDPL